MAVKWLKTGSDSVNLEKHNKEAIAKQQAERGLLYRFFLKEKEEALITFVDGELSPENYLIPPRFYEHFAMHNGVPGNYVCPEKTNPNSGEICPLCKAGNQAALVSVFTIIDHRAFKRKDGSVVPFSKKILAAKTGSMELLTKQAIKRGGLAGCTFEVSRMTAKSASIGDVFDFVEKGEALALYEKFKSSKTDDKGVVTIESLFSPADFEKEIIFRSAEELSQMGLAVSTGQYSPGGASGHNKPAPASSTDYKDQL